MSARQKVALTLGVVALGLSVGYCSARQSPSAPTPAPERPQRVEPSPPGVAPSPRTTRPEEPGVDDSLVDQHNPWPPDKLEPQWREPYFPFMADEDHTASVSVGDVSNGHLINAVPLMLPGMTYDILERQRARGLAWGSAEVITLIERAASFLWRGHRRRLWLGNIGRRGGGDIPYSVSHNSGRDADLAFCYINPKGYPVDPPDLVPLDKNGVSTSHGGYYRFDEKRTWTVIKALITHRTIQVQYIFLSNPLKKMLLDHARKKGEPAALIGRADAVMGQPGYALPHNDHIHLRIYCSQRDVLGGCRNTGTIHHGTRQYKAERATRVRVLAIALEHEQEEQRARAIERLVLLNAREHVPAFVPGLADESPRVRSAAALALGQLGAAKHAAAIAARFPTELEPAVQVDMLEALRMIGGPQAGSLLAKVLAEPEFAERVTEHPLPDEILSGWRPAPPIPEPPEGQLPLTQDEWRQQLTMGPADATKPSGHLLDLQARKLNVRLAAVEVAADSERPEPVGPLIKLLAEPDPVLRARAARALRRLTNHSADIDWANPALSVEAQQSGVARWQGWHRRHRQRSRADWVAMGFREAGYDVPELDRRHIWEIVRAVPDADHLSYNSQRALMTLSSHRPLSLSWPKSDAAWHWTRWFRRRRAKFRLPPPPASLAPYNR